MTDETLPASVERALDAHDAFEPRPDEPGYDLTTTRFETTVTANEAEGERDGAFCVLVRLPTLDASVPDGVATVVEDGWFETLERRLQEVFSVTRTSLHDDEPAIERDVAAGEVRVVLEYVSWDADEGVEDAKALIEYVEGTYAQGIIPGYEYTGPAAELLDRARSLGRQPTEEASDADTSL